MIHSASFVLAMALAASLPLSVRGAAPSDDPRFPRLQKHGTATQLIVDGKPLLIRGGELGNSTGEPDYLRPSWPALKALGLNAVVAPIYWDVIEPAEGRFVFGTIDGLLRDARANEMKLVLLWFGTWKNSMSCYAPSWVKTDSARFPRVLDASGRPEEIVTPFSAAACEADAKAFAAVMRHLRETDGKDHTVVLVQVENEIGMIPCPRDHSAEADRQFAAPVPSPLIAWLREHRPTLAPELAALWAANGGRESGTWAEVFGAGPAGEEAFMAWHFARYTNLVAAAGKAEFPLPMYVNAALIRPAYQPGQYPSAGPLPHLFDIWRAGAPAIDLLSPDIYFPNFAEWTARFTRNGNALFIPEALRSGDASINALYAFSQHDAIGFCPFGIESIAEPASGLLAGSFKLIAQLTPVLLEHQGTGSMAGLLPPASEQRQPHRIQLGRWFLNAMYERGWAPQLADGVIVPPGAGGPSAPTLPAGGLVIALGPDELLFAGMGTTITFDPAAAGEVAGLLSVEEGCYVDGQWRHLRWLNGDQTHQGRHVRLEPGRFCIQRVRLYSYR